MENPSIHCPYVGLKQNRSIRFASPTPEHRCYITGDSRDIPVDQTTYCLSDNHITCPLYMGLDLPSMPYPNMFETLPAESKRVRGWFTRIPSRDRLIYIVLLTLLLFIIGAYIAVGKQLFEPKQATPETPTSLAMIGTETTGRVVPTLPPTLPSRVEDTPTPSFTPAPTHHASRLPLTETDLPHPNLTPSLVVTKDGATPWPTTTNFAHVPTNTNILATSSVQATVATPTPYPTTPVVQATVATPTPYPTTPVMQATVATPTPYPTTPVVQATTATPTPYPTTPVMQATIHTVQLPKPTQQQPSSPPIPMTPTTQQPTHTPTNTTEDIPPLQRTGAVVPTSTPKPSPPPSLPTEEATQQPIATATPLPAMATQEYLTLYFPDSDGLLVSIQRLAHVYDNQVAHASLRELIAGPPDYLQRIIPVETHILDVSRVDNTITVNLDRQPTNDQGLLCIALTMTEFPGVAYLQFQVNGANVGLNGGNAPMIRPIVNRDNPLQLPTDYESGTRFLPLYFVNRNGSFVRVTRLVPRTLQIARATVEELLKGPGSYSNVLSSPIPDGTALRSVQRVDRNLVLVDVTQPFVDASDRQAAINALVFSLTELRNPEEQNARFFTQVEIEVNGQDIAEFWGEEYRGPFPRPLLNP